MEYVAMATEDTDMKKQQRSQTFSMKSVLEGSWLAEKLNQNKGYVLLGVVVVIFYIANGYSMEKLYREQIVLEKELKELRFESITRAADLMFIRKQSEVIKRIEREGLNLEESKEPPVKLYRK